MNTTPGLAPTANDYDIVAYPGHAQAQTHPERLASVATMHGLDAAPVTRCRVLELGCGDGANLVPMAFQLPDSRFLGVDLAAAPIARATALAAEAGLGNVEFRQLDVMTIGRELGEFDYIIAHGLFSWVPEPVRVRVLELCAQLLAPRGVAFISYNAYPGSHITQLVRGMMRYHVRDLDQPRQRIDEALAVVRFLADGRKERDLYNDLLGTELKRLEAYGDGPIFHDDLAEVMQPFWFHEFVARATAHGLQYLGEADAFEMQEHIWSPQVTAALRSIPERLVREQYLDFLKNRHFRQTLLCRADQTVTMPIADRLRSLQLSSPAKPVARSPNLKNRRIEEFRGEKGARVSTDLPVAKGAMVHLAACWPQAIGFAELLDAARQLSASAAAREEDATALASFLFATYGAGVVEAHGWAPKLGLGTEERPQASRLARLQATRGEILTNLSHAPVRVEDGLGRRLLPLLDGTRDRAALVEALASKEQPSARIAAELPAALARLGRLALLVG